MVLTSRMPFDFVLSAPYEPVIIKPVLQDYVCAMRQQSLNQFIGEVTRFHIRTDTGSGFFSKCSDTIVTGDFSCIHIKPTDIISI